MAMPPLWLSCDTPLLCLTAFELTPTAPCSRSKVLHGRTSYSSLKAVSSLRQAPASRQASDADSNLYVYAGAIRTTSAPVPASIICMRLMYCWRYYMSC